MNKKQNTTMTMIALIVSGCAIYELAYLLYNYYDVMLEAFNLTDGQLGTLMSVFGTVALICYFPGGWFADWFSAKKLIIISLVSTSILGIWFYTLPSYKTLLVIYALWGVTVTLPFWAALLKATRQLGDSDVQGKLFGILEAGRGLLPLAYGFLILALFNKQGGGVEGLKTVIMCYIIIGFLGALIVWLFFKEDQTIAQEKTAVPLKDLLKVTKDVNVWIVSLIIITIYVVYATMTYINPYLTEFFNVSDSTAAALGLVRTYGIAIFGGLLGGIIADKIKSKARMIIYSALVAAAGVGAYLVISPKEEAIVIAIGAMIFVSLGVYMTRGIYFAVIDEIKIPLSVSGAAVGFASVIGFIPDAVIYTICGSWLDKYPGEKAYQMIFLLMFICGISCAILSYILYRRIKNEKFRSYDN